jgi:hypothetical protein
MIELPVERRQCPVLVIVVLLAVYAAGVAVALSVPNVGHRPTVDEQNFHLPTIVTFAEQLPRPDLTNYDSATTPGYHLAMAIVRRCVSDRTAVLRLASAGFTVGLLVTLAMAVTRRLPCATGLMVTLPAVCSPYVFSSGVWLLPENLGWWLVLATLLLAFRDEFDARGYAAIAAVLLALAFVRQSHLWAAGVLWVAALAGHSTALGKPDVRGNTRHALRRLLPVVLATIPAFSLVGYFVYRWGGLTPPQFQAATPGAPWGTSVHRGANPAAPAMVLAVLGAIGTFFAGFVWPQVRDVVRQRGPGLLAVLAGGLAGTLAAVVVRTDFDRAAGRVSGLWNISKAFPVVGGRSTLIVALAALGGVCIVLWALALARRDRAIWLGAWACFIAAQVANSMAWQRYYEPFCLIMMPLAVSRLPDARAGRLPRIAGLGPLALAALLAAATVFTLWPGRE